MEYGIEGGIEESMSKAHRSRWVEGTTRQMMVEDKGC